MNDIFLRTRMILGDEAMERLRRSHVAVFGLGGVGSYAAEALARSGVGELTLIDRDTVSSSNINRQLYALHSTVGQFKAEVAARRCLDIDPSIRVHPLRATYDAAHREEFFAANYDYIIDNDTVEGAVEEFFAILTAERCRKDRRIHLVEGV